MKLVSYRHNELIQWGIVDNHEIKAISSVAPDLPRTLQEVIEGWEQYEPRIQMAATAAAAIKLDAVTLLPPIDRPSKILCIGRNYSKHALEQGAEVPTEPIVFSKFATALIGHQSHIVIPKLAEKVDYEGELVVVIGRRGRNISEADAHKHLFGLTCGNDVTARDWQKGRPGGQWLLGKSIETFGPLGPWIVTSDEVNPLSDRNVKTRVNDQLVQNGNTRQFLFSLRFLISHLSRFFTLEPGDLLFTGTPEGVGIARNPPLLLSDGDRVEVEIEGIGTLTNHVRE